MANDEPRVFGELLRRYRLAAGLTERARLSVRGLADLERGARRCPYPETAERLAEALQLGERSERHSWRPAHGRAARRPRVARR